jgi:glycosyltransferase involved in cell wall biosynthesis
LKIAVLLFSNFPDGSAMGRRTHFLCKGLAEHGNEVHVVVAQRFNDGPMYEEIDGIKVYWSTHTTPSTFHDLSERLRNRWSTYRILKRLFCKGIDWLILIYPELDRLPHLLLAKKFGVKIISTYDDHRNLSINPSIRNRLLVLRGQIADKLIPRMTNLNLVISALLEAQIRRVAPNTPILKFPPIVDTNLFNKNKKLAKIFRTDFGLGDHVIIAYLGTYWYVEGLSILLASAILLKQEGVEFRLVISGKPHMGFMADDVSSLVKKYQLSEIVVETGWLSLEKVVECMSAADILVVPKLTNIANEAGMPTKLAEYLSIGCSVVASKVGDIPLYLTDYKDALLCEPSDIKSLADKLRILIMDRSLRDRLALNSRLTASKHFDYRTVSEGLNAVMSRLL